MRKTKEIVVGGSNHAICVLGNMLYISDGVGKIYEYEIPKETVWEKLAKALGFKKYSYKEFSSTNKTYT